MTFVPVDLDARSFTCPHCGVLARQYKWAYKLDGPSAHWGEGNHMQGALRVARCENCGGNCIWVRDVYVYPDRGNAPVPNPDMPEEVKADYEEAARTLPKSPRGAAALIRLALQKLMVHLGESGKNINDDIAALVKKGLPVQVQRALDVVRVTGNNAVHPGQLDTNDISMAERLFPFVSHRRVSYFVAGPRRGNVRCPPGRREGGDREAR